MAAPAVDGILLAGGLARRMAGRDKGLLPLAGRPLAAWVAGRLVPQVGHLVVSANRNAAAYARLGYPVVGDSLTGHPGPLAGILAAGEALAGEWLLVVPCDLPFLPPDLAARLHGAAGAQGLDAVYAAEPDREHYAVLLLRRTLLADLAAYLAAGERQVRAWLLRQGARGVVFPDAGRGFFNINTPEELALAEGYLAADPDLFHSGA